MNAKRKTWNLFPETEASRLRRRNFLRLIGGSAALDLLDEAHAAEPFPNRPVTLVVPYAAGGGTDVLGRILAERMRLTLGQPVVVENVTGAAGNVGVGRVARATPDGYTVVLGNMNTHTTNALLYELQFDVLRDFEPIALLTRTPQIIVARKDLPAPDLVALAGWLKANSGKATFSTDGHGAGQHLAGLLLEKAIGTQLVFVPYRGSAPAVQALLAGQVDVTIAPGTVVLPHVRSGAVRAYAVTGPSRLPAAPEIPAADEAGLPGVHYRNWIAVWAPKATPKEAIAKLNASLVEALSNADVLARLGATGQLVAPADEQSSEALKALQKAELEIWRPLIKAANLRGE